REVSLAGKVDHRLRERLGGAGAGPLHARPGAALVVRALGPVLQRLVNDAGRRITVVERARVPVVSAHWVEVATVVRVADVFGAGVPVVARYRRALASVAVPIAVVVLLPRIRHERAVVVDVADAVLIRIQRAVAHAGVACIAPPIPIGVGLAR